jgi:hypothetical protein
VIECYVTLLTLLLARYLYFREENRQKKMLAGVRRRNVEHVSYR